MYRRIDLKKTLASIQITVDCPCLYHTHVQILFATKAPAAVVVCFEDLNFDQTAELDVLETGISNCMYIKLHVVDYLVPTRSTTFAVVVTFVNRSSGVKVERY